MSWVKNKHGGYRSPDGQFYLQQSPKKFFHLFAKRGEGWKMIAGPFSDPAAGMAAAG